MAFNPTGGDIGVKGNFNPSDPESGKSKVNTLGSNYVKCSNTMDKSRIQKYWDDLLEQIGVNINYWSHGYSYDSHDFLYGEDTTSSFRGPRTLKGFVEIKTDNAILTKFGIMSDNDVELIIPITEFRTIWGGDVIPNIGDLFSVEEESCDRPENQAPKVFQVTEKYDKMNPTDLFGGHYIWKLTAKRYDYSYEPNAPDETENTPNQESDTTFFGVMSGGTQTESKDKAYADNVDDSAKEDMDNTNNSEVYGKYY